MTENELYHQDTTRISKSGLDQINLAPAKYFEKYLSGKHIQIKTEALINGAAGHSILFEPEKFKTDFVVSQSFSGEGSRSRQAEFIHLNAGKQPIGIDVYDMISRMRDEVLKHPIASLLIKSGQAEKTIKWIDKQTSAPCKARLDFLNNENYIIDYKTTEDASNEGFKRSILKYRYDVQDAFYTDGCHEVGIPVKRFIFIAQEKTPPYLVKCHFLGEQEIELGRVKYQRNLETYMECKRTGIWGGYENTFNQVEFPSWEFEKYGMSKF